MIESQDPQTVPGRSVLGTYSHGIPVFSSLNLAKLKCIHQNLSSVRIVSDFTFAFHLHALEKEMATHSGVLAWRIPGTGEPGGLPSMGLHRVGHD